MAEPTPFVELPARISTYFWNRRIGPEEGLGWYFFTVEEEEGGEEKLIDELGSFLTYGDAIDDWRLRSNS